MPQCRRWRMPHRTPVLRCTKRPRATCLTAMLHFHRRCQGNLADHWTNVAAGRPSIAWPRSQAEESRPRISGG